MRQRTTAAAALAPSTDGGARDSDAPAASSNSIAIRTPPEVVAPTILEQQQPAYPRQARRRGLEGRVLLRAQVDAQGLVAAVKVIASSGHAILDQAASENVRLWRFAPAQAEGRAVAGWAQVPIVFSLND